MWMQNLLGAKITKDLHHNFTLYVKSEKKKKKGKKKGKKRTKNESIVALQIKIL